MQRCRQSRRHASFWVIITNDRGNGISNKYHLLKLSYDHNTERLLETLCQRNVVWQMPSYMNNILMAVHKKRISCSFCHQFLLNHIGRISKEKCFYELLSMFDGEESFSLHCIYAIYHGYICRALTVIAANEDELPLSRDAYWLMFIQCKEQAIRKQCKRRNEEKYLGKVPFPDDLRRSFDEFLRIIRNVFGFWPYKVENGCPDLSPV